MRIFIHDELPPEASAMLQALYSRSAESVETHIAKVRERGPDKFMAGYYVGYGHASIGDCGYTTLYIEDVSALACKAVQDNPLFSGQETSTRYIDFSDRRVVDPVETGASRAILDRWLAFYAQTEPVLRDHLTRVVPRPLGQGATAWRKAIAARAFDILRGFLPAGITSQTAWTTNLRQGLEHGLRLSHHPLTEVREIGAGCLASLGERYPSSFSQPARPDLDAYQRKIAAAETYLAPDFARPSAFESVGDVDNAALEAEAREIISARPRKASLPKSLARFGRYRCRFRLDFGSFRDLQRHRGGACRMPLLTDLYGLHPWYLDQLPPSSRDEAKKLLSDQSAAIRRLAREGVERVDLQYFQPMGMQVDCEVHYDLPQMVYVAELRSGKTVHPTLRQVARQMGAALRAAHPRLALYVDNSDDELCARRGEQDIAELNAQVRPAA